MTVIETKLKPLDTRCVVQIFTPKSDSKIVLTEQTMKEDKESLDEGILIKRGINAFQDILEEKDRPQLGDKVNFVRYAGKKKAVPDNEEYFFRIMQDDDIYAIEEE